MSLTATVYTSLRTNPPKPTRRLNDDDDGSTYDAFNIDALPSLVQLAHIRFPSAEFAYVERLEQDGNEVVLSIIFFDEDGDIIGGGELTKDKMYWDDEGDDSDDEE